MNLFRSFEGLSKPILVIYFWKISVSFLMIRVNLNCLNLEYCADSRRNYIFVSLQNTPMSLNYFFWNQVYASFLIITLGTYNSSHIRHCRIVTFLFPWFCTYAEQTTTYNMSLHNKCITRWSKKGKSKVYGYK